MARLSMKVLSLFFLALVPFAWSGGYNMLIDVLNKIIQVIGPAAIRVIGLFPPNPCLSLVAGCTETLTHLPTPSAGLMVKILNCIAWLLPIQYMVDVIGCAMLSVMIFFTMAPLARFFKLIT